MSRKHAAGVHFERLIPFAILLVVAAFGYASSRSSFHAQTAEAAGTGNFAWSENVGWISFDCANDSSCGSSSYKVSEGADGALSGYAWSSNIGWISFNAADVAGCPEGGANCAPRVDVSQNGVRQLSGWARACGSFDNKASCSGSQSAAGGWTGWIHLNGTGGDGTHYGVTQSGTGCGLSGWAYGGGDASNGSNAVIGWIHFNGNGYQAAVADAGSGCSNQDVTQGPQVALTASPNPTAAAPNNQTRLSWSVTPSAGTTCGDIIYNDQNNVQQHISTGGATSGTTAAVTVPPPQTVFTLTCTNSVGTGYGSVTVVVPTGVPTGCVVTLTASPTRVAKDGVSSLSWTTTPSCSACVITDSPPAADSTFPYTLTGAELAQGSGSKQTDPIDQSTTFTLSCNSGSAQAQTTIGVQPTIIHI